MTLLQYNILINRYNRIYIKLFYITDNKNKKIKS